MKNRILIIQTAFIGDAILTLPMIQKLKELENDSVIDVVAIPSTAEIFKASQFINDVLVLDKRGKHKSLKSLFTFSKEIKSRGYSKLYSPHRSFRTSLLVLLSEVRETYGFNIASFSYVYKYLISYQKEHHEVKRNLSLIGVKTDNENWKIQPKLEINQKRKERVAEFISKNRIDKFVAIAPGSVWNTKKYPEAHFVEVIKKIIAKGSHIILIGSEKDSEQCNRICDQIEGEIFNSAGAFDLIETTELLKHAEMLICNDSAPTHLGMIADIPVLTLYCSTVPSFGFYPYNSKSRCLSFEDLDCKPCGIHGYEECPIKTFDCGYKLQPSTVFETVEQMISK